MKEDSASWRWGLNGPEGPEVMSLSNYKKILGDGALTEKTNEGSENGMLSLSPVQAFLRTCEEYSKSLEAWVCGSFESGK